MIATALVRSGLVVGALLALAGQLHARSLLPPQPDEPGDAFGRVVAFVGGRVAVGAPGRTVNGVAGAGVVYLYELDGTLAASRSMPGAVALGADDGFGFAVADAGGQLVVGVPGADVDGKTDAGRVWVFDPDGAALELDPGDRAAGDRFGYAVAALGTSVLVGAPGADTTVANGGAVYRFAAAGGAPLRKFTRGALAVADDGLGYAVAAHAGDVLAGAPRVAALTAGAAFVFDADQGTVLATFSAGGPSPEDHFGATVASNGADLLVGAPFDDAFDEDAGAVWVFANGDPQNGQALGAGTAQAGSLFGAALAAVGSDTLVGAPFESTGATQAGSAYRIVNATAAVTKTFRAPTPTRGALLGSAVAASGGVVAVSALGVRAVHLVACDDGVRDPGEPCDQTDDAVCPNRCNRVICTCGTTPAVCGDGTIKGREECDDGGTEPCDGCSDTCRIEVGWMCGDSSVNETCGEQCDDGGTDPGDGCSAQCRFECATPADCLAAVTPARDAACRQAECVSGECAFTPELESLPCGTFICCDGAGHCGRVCDGCSDDDDACTQSIVDPLADQCTNTPVTCDDGHPCTTDSCDPNTGCAFAAIEGCQECETDADCNPGTPPKTEDLCVDGICLRALDCADGDLCTVDFLVSGRCEHVRRSGCCDDDGDCDDECRSDGNCKLCNYCTIFSYGEACCTRPPLERPRCRGGITATDGAACAADTNVCTADTCGNGNCIAGAALECDDGDVCTIDACTHDAGCTFTPVANGESCGDACTDARCVGGVCQPGEPILAEGAPCAYAGPLDECVIGDARCRAGTCTPGRACDVEVSVVGTVPFGPACKQAARRLRLVVECTSVDDGGAASGRRSRPRCKAIARASGVIGKHRPKRMIDGLARLPMKLNGKGRKQLCAETDGALQVVVTVSLRDRKERLEVERTVTVELSGVPQ